MTQTTTCPPIIAMIASTASTTRESRSRIVRAWIASSSCGGAIASSRTTRIAFRTRSSSTREARIISGMQIKNRVCTVGSRNTGSASRVSAHRTSAAMTIGNHATAEYQNHLGRRRRSTKCARHERS
jgi:hypothetical protein